MFRFTAEKMNQNAFTSAPCAEAASACASQQTAACADRKNTFAAILLDAILMASISIIALIFRLCGLGIMLRGLILVLVRSVLVLCLPQFAELGPKRQRC